MVAALAKIWERQSEIFLDEMNLSSPHDYNEGNSVVECIKKWLWGDEYNQWSMDFFKCNTLGGSYDLSLIFSEVLAE